MWFLDNVCLDVYARSQRTHVNKICRLYNRFTLTVGNEELFLKSSEMKSISVVTPPPTTTTQKKFLYLYQT